MKQCIKKKARDFVKKKTKLRPFLVLEDCTTNKVKVTGSNLHALLVTPCHKMVTHPGCAREVCCLTRQNGLCKTSRLEADVVQRAGGT